MGYLFWLLSGFLLLGGKTNDASMYVQVPYHSYLDIKNYVSLGYEVAGISIDKHEATLLIKKSQLRQLERMDFEIFSKREVFGPDSEYKKPSDVENILKTVAQNYPTLTNLQSIGKTLEGRDVWAIELTDKSSGDISKRPTVLFDAMHHAREVMSPEVALDIVDSLTKNYPTDPDVKKWMTSYRIWVVPMLNPDGNNQVWTNESMWRKNTRGGYGVDINRNYPYAWNTCNGSSNDTGADDYHGSGPASEPETNNIMNLVNKINPVFDISYHSFSELVIYPYGCSPNHIPDPDKEIYEGVGRELASKLVKDESSGTYDPGTSYELLYNVDGGSIDWMYAQSKVMAFVIEINSGNQGFQPSYKEWRDKTVMKQREGWKYILNRMDGPGIRKLED